MMSYADFVKKHYDMVRDLPARERFTAIAKMYHAQKGDGKAHGKAPKVKAGMLVAGALDIPKKHSKKHKVKAGILVGGSEPSSPMSAHSMDRDPLGLRSMMF